MIQITRELLREWQACYSDEELDATVPASGLTPLQILELDIPADDRLWVVLREAVIPARALRLLACKWAREALAVAGNPDPRSVDAVDCAERLARGEATTEEWAAARDAARDAARAAARAAAWAAASDAAWAAGSDAAWAAASDAARAAARDAARDAARAAARAAAWAAASDAAWAAASDAQISDCKSVIQKLPC
jgi:hypothetical protein